MIMWEINSTDCTYTEGKGNKTRRRKW